MGQVDWLVLRTVVGLTETTEDFGFPHDKATPPVQIFVFIKTLMLLEPLRLPFLHSCTVVLAATNWLAMRRRFLGHGVVGTSRLSGSDMQREKRVVNLSWPPPARLVKSAGVPVKI